MSHVCGNKMSGTIRAYLHEKVVKVSWFEELCPVCGNKMSGTIRAYLHEKVPQR